MASYQQGTVCIDFKKDPTMAVQPEFKGTSILVKAALFAFVGTVFLLSASQMLPSGADSTLAISLKPTSTAPATRGSFSFFPHFFSGNSGNNCHCGEDCKCAKGCNCKACSCKKEQNNCDKCH
eukprot:TRINITY_DN1745_c0_g1_i1.p2 TRINITY_DN1745_c0_g1~~TRINITY_DN1745_c0_g1_i1.p2  ORF type:complete len:130 (+),score=15.93 TRINITY_DN1745_c0_g1_i1:23-391(+)